MKHSVTALVLIGAACASLPALAEEVSAADLTALRAASGSLATALGAEMKKELTANGPEAAITVCRDKAPQIAGEMSRKNGWKVTRVSLKVRNPLLGTPDAWEQAALKKLQDRLSAGEKPETLDMAEIVTEPAGRFLRFAKGIPVQTACLACHGGPDDVTPNVKAKLADAYPMDKATGYSVGMLRGAVSIKKPLD
jgi:hypothetical protein